MNRVWLVMFRRAGRFGVDRVFAVYADALRWAIPQMLRIPISNFATIEEVVAAELQAMPLTRLIRVYNDLYAIMEQANGLSPFRHERVWIEEKPLVGGNNV